MKKKDKQLLSVFLRYIILLIIGLVFAFSDLIYRFFLILTIYPVNFLLSFFYETLIYNSFILMEKVSIDIIPACVAVSAYFLLLILNLATPMKPKKRAYSLLFSLFLLLIVNVLRIFILTILLINEVVYFEIIHEIFWYFLSIVIVILIWFLTIWLFKIKNIPAYSDIKLLLKASKRK